ncbi:Leucine rich repeat N-terminal domain [Seminavis robusta]|uniref:Leucine rich repeat N-terminal domain n=1 Tax=Seminavis robusta TaxID=568900 RepID=A0A9N8HJ27_9STRA|nr:Leucine rich repeat N-terminal domain [Seminavis robusta]|eukprot:Sro532_g161380.1 Leucine rich repeat N-terminal domain (706) ;mRNA; f:1724-4100
MTSPEDEAVPEPQGHEVEQDPENSGLAVAAPVTVGDVESAHPVSPEQEEIDRAREAKKRKETNFMIAIGTLVAIAFIVMLVIIFIVKGENDDSPPPTDGNITAGNTSIPLSPEEVLTGLLPDDTLPNLEFEYTPQAKAFKWVAEDPNFDSYSDKRLQQRFALATFYYSSNGDGDGWGNKTNWLNVSVHQCNWDFIMPNNLQYHANHGNRYDEYKYIDGPCVPKNASMVGNYSTAMDVAYHDDFLYLALVGQELDGSIPPEIAMLTSLKMIQFDSTTMEGPIPTILANLTGLRELYIYDTFTGTIPTELAQLSELRTLNIGGATEIWGTLPSEFGLLSILKVLKIAETNISGTIPMEYTHLSPWIFRIFRNSLTGTIHTEFGLFSDVEWFFIERNDLTGSVPSELGLMSRMQIIYAYEMSLSGTIPTELGLLSSIAQIYLQTNSLTGTIPTELGIPTENFWRLAVSRNLLTGTVPSELRLLTKCANLATQANLLTSTIPTEVAALPAMEYFSNSDNLYSGIFPMELFFNGSKMVRFWFENNEISGTIPTEIGYWTSLWNFRLDGNWITGTIPSEVGTLVSKLEYFNAGSNQLFGEIPTEIGNLLKLKEFSVGDNGLTGTLPKELGFLVTNGTLKHLNVSNNDGLFGTIGSEVCALTADPVLSNVLDFTCGDLCGCDCPCDNASSLVLYGQNCTVLAEMKSWSSNGV